MELSVAGQLAVGRRPVEVVDRYFDALGMAGARADALKRDISARLDEDAAAPAPDARATGAHASPSRTHDARAALAAMHAALARDRGDTFAADDPARASVRARLDVALAEMPLHTEPLARRDLGLATSPPLARTPMAPADWLRGRVEGMWRRKRAPQAGDVAEAPTETRDDWHPVSWHRRLVLVVFIIGQTWLATDLMRAVLPYHGGALLEIPILVLFAILFGWVSAGFWTAVAGFFVLAKGGDRWAISRTAAPDAPIAVTTRTAVIMPIANEDVARVFAGLRATYESVARTGLGSQFDFFVLSDSANPDIRVAELTAWFNLCRDVDGFKHIFYRWRAHRIKRKSGNVADFCRRWGKDYRYMIVLDADSVMSGECVTTLVRLAEANPDVGILQSAPKATGRDTLYARVQQFATGVYGPVFTAGLHYWQLGESHYWGHNAIIRVAPFIRYCALGRLPGSGNLSGEILSHDFVEAALMRRAGWGVWIVYDLPGSYEEMPPNLIDELKRDRRWCQGNLMNFRLALMKGLHPAHRVVFTTGVMAYLSAPLWFAFLLLSTASLAIHTLVIPEYFSEPHQMFPLWPEWRPDWAIQLVAATAVLLFLPKLLAVLLLSGKHAPEFGGRIKLWLSALGEMLLSMLFAPIRMLFHTRFVVIALAGWAIQWRSPARDDASTTWGYAIRQHGAQTLLGVAWAAFVTWLNPAFLGWLAPVAGALIVSIPLSVYTSRASLGRAARNSGLFLIPEEVHTPREINAMTQYLDAAPAPATFATAMVDPVVNALVSAVALDRRRFSVAVRRDRALLAREALDSDPAKLAADKKTRLLGDAGALSWLHFHTWLNK
jgi:membrane glycosyltransferase